MRAGVQCPPAGRTEEQQGAHYIFSPDILADHVPLLSELAAAMEARTGCTHIRRVLIAACKEKALRFLGEQMQITAGTIFPDVEGLGKFLHWHLESLVTTLLCAAAVWGRPSPVPAVSPSFRIYCRRKA